MKRISLLCVLAFVFAQNASAAMMLRTSPLPLLIGAVNADLGFQVTNNLSIAVGGTTWSAELLDVEFEFSEFHGRLDYYFNGTYQQGWYLSAQAGVATFDLTTEDSLGTEFTGDVSGTSLAFLAGYHWQWTSFFIDLGAGFTRFSFDSELELEDENGNTEEETIPAVSSTGLEFNIGWVF